LALEQRRTFWVQEALLQVQHLVMILAVLVPLWIHTQSKLFNAPKRILHDRVDSRHRTSEHGQLVLEPLVVLARRLRNANLVEMWQSNKHAQRHSFDLRVISRHSNKHKPHLKVSNAVSNRLGNCLVS
jgi:hypothetical protein